MDGLSKSRVDWTAAAFAAALAYALFLIAMFLGHFWLRDAHGAIVANDFTVFQTGDIAHFGNAAVAYDWQADHDAQVAAIRHEFPGDFPWSYPPPFLFIAVLLAHLPYLLAFLLWTSATLAAYAFVIARIADKPGAWLAACAFPAVLLCVYVGQTGLLTAALLGAMLLTLEKRPLLSGVFLGLLIYKPQFGILLPFALLAGGYWRALGAATITAVFLVLVSILVFGSDAWVAFFHATSHTADVILVHGRTGWNKLQTVYGFARWIGAGDSAAWNAQLAVAALMLLGLVFIWRSKMPFALKAAGLCIATLLATPYAYIYDFPIMAVAIAFLYRDRAFNTYETCVLLAAAILLILYPWAAAPLGFAASLMVASLVSRRGRKPALSVTDVALQRA